MEQIGNDIFAFVGGSAAMGALISACIQGLKGEYNWQGRFVKYLTFWISLGIGLLAVILTSEGHGWRAVSFIILRGIVAGVMVALSALGVHNWFRPTGKQDAQTAQDQTGQSEG